MTMRLYVAVQHSPPAIGSFLINLGTQACVPSGWVIGPKDPATHAYVVCDLDGHLLRLDGEPGGATFRDAGAVWPAGGPRTAAWELVGFKDALHPTGLAIGLGIDRMRALTGTAYDWSEILAASVEAFNILPGLRRLRFLGRADAFKRAMICTKVVFSVLEACGGPAAKLATSLPDLYPERLGQALRGCEGSWTRRVA